MKECSVCKQPTGMERLKNDNDPNSGYEPLCHDCSAKRDASSRPSAAPSERKP